MRKIGSLLQISPKKIGKKRVGRNLSGCSSSRTAKQREVAAKAINFCLFIACPCNMRFISLVTSSSHPVQSCLRSPPCALIRALFIDISGTFYYYKYVSGYCCDLKGLNCQIPSKALVSLVGAPMCPIL